MIYYVLIVISVLLFLAKPLWGLAFLFVFFPSIQTAEGINIKEIYVLLLIVILCFSWLSRRLKHGTLFLKNKVIEGPLIVLFLYSGFSLFVAMRHGYDVVDWGRDLFPLLSLTIILPLSEFVRTKKQFELLFYLFLGVVIFGIFKWFLFSIARVGFVWIPLFIYLIPFSGNTISLYILSILGIASFLEYKSIKPRYAIPAFMSIVVVFFNLGRTLWIAIPLSLSLLLLFTRNRLRGLAVIFLALFLIITFVPQVFSESTGISGQYRAKLSTFQNLGSDLSWQNRVAEYKKTWSLFLESPLYGMGIGYEYSFYEPFVKQLGGPGFLKTNYTHSDFLNFLAKTGFLGILILGIFFYNIITTSWREYKRANSKESKTLYLSVLVLTITILIIGNSTPFLQARLSSYFLASLIGFMFVKRRLDKNEE